MNNKSSKTIAIIGAGVAGGRLAGILARNGVETLIFDHRSPWEKPCGGGLTAKVFDAFPEFNGLNFKKRRNHDIEVITPFGRRSGLYLDKPIVTVSRKEFGKNLLDDAVKSGVRFISERAMSLKISDGRIIICTAGGEYMADFIVGADGTGSIVKKYFSSPFEHGDLFLAYGYLIPEEIQSPIIIKFFRDYKGYAWIFPRNGETSAGITSGGRASRDEMLKTLREFVCDEWKLRAIAPPEFGKPYAKHLPSLSRESFDKTVLCGNNWALIGDASGAVDPLTGEGIFYALKSADLLADALLKNNISLYEEGWRKMAGPSIRKVAKVVDKFYAKRWLWVLGIFMHHSITLRRTACEVMTGSQGYETLKPRIKREALRYLFEAILSILKISSR